MQLKKIEFLKLLHKRQSVGLFLLIVAGFLGNYFRWTLFFGIDFIFGSIAVWLVVCLYGVRWGTFAAFVAGLCTYFLWSHPYSIITFTAEALFVGGLFYHRRQRHALQSNLVILDAVFWLLLGMPLVWLFYAVILQFGFSQALIILLKQPVNGIFNALIASLLLTHLPIYRWMDRPPTISALSLQQTLVNLLVAFVMIPVLLLTMLSSQQVVDDIKTAARADLNDASRYLTVEMETWHHRRLSVVTELAAIAGDPSFSPETLKQHGEFAQRIVPDFHHIHVLNGAGERVQDFEHDIGLQSGQFDEHVYFEMLKRSPTPFLSPVVIKGSNLNSYTVVAGAPIFKDGRLNGAVLGEIDLSGVTELLRANVDTPSLTISLVDPLHTVAASTRPEQIGVENFDWRKSGNVEKIGPYTYHWLPNDDRPFLVRWNNSFFVKEEIISQDIPWNLVVEIAASPHVQHIEQVHTKYLMILLAVAGLAPVVAVLVSRQLAKPVTELAEMTTNLPNKLLDQEPPKWTQSRVAEFSLLSQNFRLMAASLQQKFREIQQANETLEQRVADRTQALLTSSEALRESEARFRQMAENVREVFWMQAVDRQQVLYVSPAYEEIWGRTCQSLYDSPKSFLDAVHPEDIDRVRNTFLGGIYGPVSAEYRIIKPDGSIRWIWDRGFPVYNDAGVAFRVVGVAQDITERKQADLVVQQQAERERLLGSIALQLRQSLELDDILNTTVAEARQFLQTDRVIVYQFQPDWSGTVVVEAVADGWQSILGQQITDTYFAETQGEHYKQGRIQATEDVLTAGLDECHVNLLQRLQVRANLVVPILQGDTLWGLLVAQHCRSPRVWQASEIDFLKQLATQSAIAIHQSELYQHEQQLNTILEQQVEERTAQLQQALRYEAMITRMTDKVRDSLDEEQILQTAVEELVRGLGVVCCDTALFDLEQSVITISHAFTNGGFAPHPEIVLASSFSDIYPQILEGQSLQFCELIPKFKDPTWEPRTVFACPIIDDQGVLGKLRLFRDKAEVFSEAEIRVVSQVANQCAIALRQARLFEAAQGEVKALEQLNRLKDDFLSTVSHELRTPISNMRMAIHMLGMNPTEERRDRYFEILKSECAREADLINDLLDLQRLASGTKTLELETIHLQEWMDEVIEPFCERTQSRQQTLEVSISPDISVLTSDRGSLTRIFAELLNNACKYTPPGETIRVTLQPIGALASHNGKGWVASEPSTPWLAAHLKLSVCNSGVEIPEEEYARIFERFYRIPGVDRWKQGGTGLGLALVQKLAEHIGGAIYVESRDNTTCFSVEL